MDGNQIRKQIDENNAKIRQLVNTFVLTDEIQNLMKANDAIRAGCQHQFVDGVCEYCDSFEGAVFD